MRVSRRQLSLVDENLKSELDEQSQAESYRREVQRLSEQNEVDEDILVEALDDIDPTRGGQLDQAFHDLLCRIESVSLTDLSSALRSAGVRRCDKKRLGEGMETSLSLEDARAKTRCRLERIARAHCRIVVDEAPQDVVGRRLDEVSARGIPEFALREIASETVESVKRLIRSNIQAVAQDPRKQREMLEAARKTLDDLEDDLIELLEDALEMYVKRTLRFWTQGVECPPCLEDATPSS